MNKAVINILYKSINIFWCMCVLIPDIQKWNLICLCSILFESVNILIIHKFTFPSDIFESSHRYTFLFILLNVDPLEKYVEMSHGGFNLHFYDYSFECLFIFIAQLYSPCCEAIFKSFANFSLLGCLSLLFCQEFLLFMDESTLLDICIIGILLPKLWLVYSFFNTVWASLVAQRLKCLPAVWKTWVRSLGQEDPLEKEMATHSSILAWRIPWMEEPGGLQSTGLQRVEHN